MDNGCCSDNCCGENEFVKISLQGPKELNDLVKLTAEIAEDYIKAMDGVKKRATSARKNLLAVKKLSLEMRKLVLQRLDELKLEK